MTYVPDLDISTYTVSSDSTWWFVSIDLVGGNPNNELGINYGVELDLDHDGFGDYLILARPPYNQLGDGACADLQGQQSQHRRSLRREIGCAADGRRI